MSRVLESYVYFHSLLSFLKVKKIRVSVYFFEVDDTVDTMIHTTQSLLFGQGQEKRKQNKTTKILECIQDKKKGLLQLLFAFLLLGLLLLLALLLQYFLYDLLLLNQKCAYNSCFDSSTGQRTTVGTVHSFHTFGYSTVFFWSKGWDTVQFDTSITTSWALCSF